jgi:hypothetical protein
MRAMMATPFLFSGAIPVSVLPAPVFSGRQFPWSRREVKRLRDNSRRRFPSDFFSESVNAFPPRNS